jgi:hypothetical protein
MRREPPYYGRPAEHAGRELQHHARALPHVSSGDGINPSARMVLVLTTDRGYRVVVANAQKVNEDLQEYGNRNRGKDSVPSGGDQVYLIRSYDHWGTNDLTELNPGMAHNIPIWEAARATTAAPTYFDTVQIGNWRFGDGGLGANNPTMEMFFEVIQMNGNAPECLNLILSIGTGQTAKGTMFGDGPFAKYLNPLFAARKLATDSENAHLKMKATAKMCNVPYERFNVSKEYGLGEMKLDEWKKPSRLTQRGKSTLDNIEEITMNYLGKGTEMDRLKIVAEKLVTHRRHRINSPLWHLTANGVQYRCTMNKCRRCQQLHPLRGHLEDHLIEHHSLQRNDGAIKKIITQGECLAV